MSSTTARTPFPAFYYYFFWLVEPLLTIAGAEYAIRRPHDYAADILPWGLERATNALGTTIRGRMVVGALGSCFLLLAMISLSLLYTVNKVLPDRPDVQETLAKALLIPLAIGDVVHIVLTLVPLPSSYLQTPGQWTTLINGNVWITVGLLVVRSAYLLGVGRPLLAAPGAKKQA